MKPQDRKLAILYWKLQQAVLKNPQIRRNLFHLDSYWKLQSEVCANSQIRSYLGQLADM